MNLESLKENDLVEYTATNSNGIEIFVTNDVETLSKIITDNSLEPEVGGVAYQDSVNTCPECGILHYIEDLHQLENDIICDKCLNGGNLQYD